MLTLLLAVAAVALGYLLGRAQPGCGALHWADWQVYGRRVTRRTSWRWYAAQAVYLLRLAARPLATVRALRTRNDPPAPAAVPVRATPWPPTNEEPRP